MSFVSELGIFLTSLLIGVFAGIGSSAPIGPTNLWVADEVIKGRMKQLRFFVAGVIAVDLVYALIAFWGYFTFILGSTLGRLLGMGGALALIGLGLSGLWELRRPQEDLTEESGADHPLSVLREFCMGILLCGANPAFILFWIVVADVMARFGATPNEAGPLLSVCLGVALGDILWYSFFVWLIKRWSRLSSPRIIWWVRFAVAASLVLFGLVAICKVLGSGKF